MNVNAKYLPVLSAIAAGFVSAETVAKKCKIEVTAARGAMRSLRGSGHIGGDNNEATMTKFGTAALNTKADAVNTPATTPTGRAHNKRSKTAKAITLFERHIGQGRQKVLAKFQSQLDMTPGAASTYFQNIRKEKGLTGATA